jgi:hypothetical protein
MTCIIGIIRNNTNHTKKWKKEKGKKKKEKEKEKRKKKKYFFTMAEVIQWCAMAR